MNGKKFSRCIYKYSHRNYWRILILVKFPDFKWGSGNRTYTTLPEKGQNNKDPHLDA